MITGTALPLESFDWFDNPYIQANLYEVDQNWIPKLSDKTKMRKCNPDIDMKFMKESYRYYYPNSICFDKNVPMYSNWFDDQYNNFFISFDSCQNTTANPTKCESLEEISKFAESNIFYVITQKTIVNKDQFEEHADDFFRDESNIYSPFEKDIQVTWYQAIPPAPQGYIPVYAMFYGIDRLQMDDSMLFRGFFSRILNFVNLKSWRITFNEEKYYVDPVT